MKALNYLNISEQVYAELSQQIISQRLKPGQRLREEQLASQFGISRTPLRDAISRLAQNGLVDIEPRKGASVKQFNIDDVVEVYDIRTVLEGLAARLAAPELNLNELKKLKALFSKKDPRSLIKADTGLHDLIINSCGNKKLMEILNNIHGLVQAFRVAGYKSRQRSATATVDHKQILKALMERDGAAAENLMRGHIQKVKQEILQNFNKQKDRR